jgi:hypothetical protein
MKEVRLSTLRIGRIYPQKYSWYSFLLEAESTPWPQCGWKNYVNIGNRTRDLPTCTTVPQPTAPPRASTCTVVKGKGKVLPLQAWMASRVGRGIALPFLDRSIRSGWVVSSTPQPHFTPGKDPLPIVQEAGWAPGPVWSAENLAPTWFDPRTNLEGSMSNAEQNGAIEF